MEKLDVNVRFGEYENDLAALRRAIDRDRNARIEVELHVPYFADWENRFSAGVRMRTDNLYVVAFRGRDAASNPCWYRFNDVSQEGDGAVELQHDGSYRGIEQAFGGTPVLTRSSLRVIEQLQYFSGGKVTSDYFRALYYVFLLVAEASRFHPVLHQVKQMLKRSWLSDDSETPYEHLGQHHRMLKRWQQRSRAGHPSIRIPWIPGNRA